MCPTHLALVHRAGPYSKKGGVIYVMKVETLKNLSPWNYLHWVLFLTDWFLGHLWAQTHMKSAEPWQVVLLDLITWSNFPLFWFWFLIIGLQGYFIFLSTGELLPSHIHDFFSLSLFLPLPPFPPLCLSFLPLQVGIFFGKFCFFMIYLLSFQSLFSVSSGYFIYHSGPLGGQSVLRHSYFWGIRCSICLANISFPLPH